MIAAPCGHGHDFHGTPGVDARHIILLVAFLRCAEIRLAGNRKSGFA
jgi:hypothetical protein